MAAKLREHKQRKLNNHVYSFPLFVSSRPHYQAEYIENRPLNKITRGTAQLTQSSTDGRKERDSNLYKNTIEKSGRLTGRLTLYIPGYLLH